MLRALKVEFFASFSAASKSVSIDSIVIDRGRFFDLPGLETCIAGLVSAQPSSTANR